MFNRNAVFFSLICLIPVLFTGCAKKAYAKENALGFQDVKKAEEAAAAKSKAVDLQSEKIAAVFSKINPRAKEYCANILANKEEFLSDLSVILAEEKTFRTDDKSLYFLIDKKHPVSSTYVPKDLIELKQNNYFNLNKKGMEIRPEAYEALKKMGLAAQKDGITLLVSSVYRSYAYQDKLFNYWVSVDGMEEAERESARPGTSQHQLATAADFGSISDDFDKTEMGQWVYKNAADYGWSLSFPKGYEDVTGYRWECWHFRYIGVNACRFQKKWFGDIQQFMLEFLNQWK